MEYYFSLVNILLYFISLCSASSYTRAIFLTTKITVGQDNLRKNFFTSIPRWKNLHTKLIKSSPKSNHKPKPRSPQIGKYKKTAFLQKKIASSVSLLFSKRFSQILIQGIEFITFLICFSWMLIFVNYQQTWFRFQGYISIQLDYLHY